MTSYTALTAESTAKRLLDAKNPLVLIHTRPDGDAIGSGAALCHFFASRGQSALLCSPDDALPTRLTFLTEGIAVCTVDELAAHTFDTIISIDVASRPQLGAIRTFLEKSSLAPHLQIDHHERGEQFADNFILPHASAAGEVLFSLLYLMENEGMIEEIPTACIDGLYAAIASDTGCFRFQNTTAETHRAAATLLARGAHAADINRLLFDTKSKELLRAEAIALQKLTAECDGRLAHIGITGKEREAAGLRDEYFETAVDIVRSLEGVEIAAVVRETEIEPGKYKISLRARSADVASVAASFGGGGHRLAAGMTLLAPDAETAWETVRPALIAALDSPKNS